MEKKEINSGIWRMSNELSAIREELIENGGELTEELEARMNAMEITKASLVDGIYQMTASVKADQAAIDEEIKRLQGLKKSRTAALEAVKGYMYRYMVNNGVERIDGALCSASIAKGRESVQTVEEEELAPFMKQISDVVATMPPFVKVTAGVNKVELKKWIEAGQPVKASCITRTPSLKIG